jgi:transposase-like protein
MRVKWGVRILFSAWIIRHAVSLFAFRLSYRDVEDLLAERGLGVSYEKGVNEH